MIAITGATGHLGKATLDHLLTKTNAANLIAIVRDVTKATDLADKGIQIRQADYTNAPSLVESLLGVDTVLLISSNATGDERVRQHENVINAAKEAGVTHIFYTSAPNPSSTALFTPAIDHFYTEELIKKSGLTYTIFRNNLYLDILPAIIGNAKQSGQLPYPAGDGKISFALRSDMAEGLANALASGEHANKVYEIGATTAWSFRDIAAAISSSEKTVTYVDVPTNEFETELQKHVPALVVQIYIGMANGIKHDDFDQPDTTLERLLNRQPVGLEDYLRNAF